MTSSKRNTRVFFTFIIVFIIARILLGSSCSDGFASLSIGSRGACSHHGGVSSVEGIVAIIIAAVASYLAFKLLKVTITDEELEQVRSEYKNEDYNLKDMFCYRCGGKVKSVKFKGDKFPYWACENIAKSKCNAKPIKKFSM
ncbi:hypothetical protein RFK95_17775 [Acinetobacter pittii]|uniref:hypothetical protein n=1 Tax=Acinetobacter calcoaceticus/baumannii complex TaxID=909768 RepID=UPI0024496897|nr:MULTISPECIES: hypothetical protein [Acinetobacter calcoaceticus/baumannii complex]MDH2493357.1 hypothetical protein [Acinetobacter baumannii]MDQ9034675.1 hypothetical protein [Acinetobacter pittii]MDQ9079672.1 hypothetical protein [Acinetobacter pittii]